MLSWKMLLITGPKTKSVSYVSMTSFNSNTGCRRRVKEWRSRLTTLLLLLLRLLEPAWASWNTSCPTQCSCQLQQSEISHKISLKTVNCSHQQLKSAPANLPLDVEALLCNSNQLADIYDYIPKLWTLRELDLSHNVIHSLGRDFIFHNLSELAYLNLAKNELTSIIRDVFNGLVQLQVLILAENKISYIEPQAFDGLSRLSTLNLACNQIGSIEPETFYGLNRLNELYLYENRIGLINSATFSAVRRLQKLSLHGNRIKHVVGDGFMNLEALTTLQLERNNMEKVPTSALLSLKKLKFLFLSGNPIAALKSGDFASLSVEEVVINAMPVLKMVEANAFFNLSRLRSVEMRDCPKLVFVDPEAFVNLTVLTHVNLENNRLRSVPQQLYHALRSSGDIALKGNPFFCDCNVRWMRKEMDVESSRNRSFLDKNQLICDGPLHTHGAQIQHLDYDTLTSQCPPTIFPLMDSNLVIEKRLGETLSLDCRAQGIPTPKIAWKLANGQTLDNSGNRSSNSVRVMMRNSGTLNFYHLKEDDTGNYTCTVENSLGSDHVTINVIVHQLDIQLFPIGVSSTFVTLVWNGTARATYPKYKILYRVAAANASLGGKTVNGQGEEVQLSNNCVANYNCISVTPFHHSYNIRNLSPDTSYEFCLAIEDADGYYVQVSCTVVCTQDINFMMQGIHRISNVAVAVVLGIIVTMVMIICVVMVAAKKYRHRQYVCPDKYPVHRMSHIPMENLYCPLMSNASPY